MFNMKSTLEEVIKLRNSAYDNMSYEDKIKTMNNYQKILVKLWH